MRRRPADLAQELASRITGRVAVDEPLGPHTTFRVGGPADVFVEVEDIDDLRVVAEVVEDAQDVAIVGRGSNLLVADSGFRGVAVKLGRSFRTAERTEHGFVFGGAMYMPAAAKLTARHGLAGFEFAAEIPGAFGGAVRMNAGAHGRSMADVLVWARTVDLVSGGEVRHPVEDLGYAYRHSALGSTEVVVDGEVVLTPGDPGAVAARIAEYLAWRREHQPPGLSAGSVFKNPPGDAAGRLIDAAGLKGHRVGGAEVSVVHANFIVMDAEARAFDAWRLIGDVRDRVIERFDVVLEPEVRFLGDFTGEGEGQLEG